MTKRWRIVCVDLHGGTIAELVFWTRRGATAYGRRLASPFYDVVLERRDGTRRVTLSTLIPPEEFIERLAAR